MRRAELWLGTLVEISAIAPSQRTLDAGVAAAFAAIARVHHALSGHDPASELSRVNRHAATVRQPISDDLRTVLACALDLAARSNGSFDTTGAVKSIDVLAYRESHGDAIKLAAWRAQFTGKRATDPVKVDADIRNISGATLSCRHVTEGVHRLLQIYEKALARA